MRRKRPILVIVNEAGDYCREDAFALLLRGIAAALLALNRRLHLNADNAINAFTTPDR